MAICCFKKCKPKICCLRCIPTQKKLLCKKEKAKTLLSCKTKTQELFQKKEKRHDVCLICKHYKLRSHIVAYVDCKTQKLLLIH